MAAPARKAALLAMLALLCLSQLVSAGPKLGPKPDLNGSPRPPMRPDASGGLPRPPMRPAAPKQAPAFPYNLVASGDRFWTIMQAKLLRSLAADQEMVCT